jgi:CheY-like chemotaxis protein
MDVEMPVMDGIAATQAIRDLEKRTGGHTPVIALTSNANRDECLAAGMDAFLNKPLHLGALRHVLGNVLPAMDS